MGLIDDYISYHEKYNKSYDNSIILYQCGGFYELYGYDDKGADIKQICEILDIQMTKRNKSNPILDKSNPFMCGLPLFVVNKYIDILVENKYTVILVEQITQPPNVKREVTKIISASTYVDNVKSKNNFLMCVYFTTGCDRNKNNFITASIAFVDIITNETFIFNCEDEDSLINLEDILKTIRNNNPTEIVFFTDIATKSNEVFINQIHNFIKGVSSNIYIHNKIDSCIDSNFFKLSYQTSMFKKVFKNTGLLSVIEYLDLEMKPVSIICFTYLLQFTYEHNDKILEGLKKPIFL